MPIIGFNFNKITVERKGPVKGKVAIKNNVQIKSVEEAKLKSGKQSSIKLDFEFISSFEPKLGEINLTGTVMYMGDSEKLKNVPKDWKKNKKLPTEVTTQVMNTVLARCHIQALMESQAVGLPSPIPLPRLKSGEDEKRYIG